MSVCYTCDNFIRSKTVRGKDECRKVGSCPDKHMLFCQGYEEIKR